MAVQTVALHRRRSRRVYWLYLIPGAVALTVIILIPFALNLWYSLHKWKGGLAPKTWIGLDNYTALLHDEAFWHSFQNSLWMIMAMVVLPTVIGLVLAAVLFDYIGKHIGSRTASFLRATYYLPQIL
ncbi:MAG: sugar ABC transporter permease, partial [Actinobacteria bacterium]|nr:sugar ABC transporter permease [Actinomycetota bacterium]MCG2802234.1 sugar ABC transporter permease [Cellulomonas sp.]